MERGAVDDNKKAIDILFKCVWELTKRIEVLEKRGYYGGVVEASTNCDAPVIVKRPANCDCPLCLLPNGLPQNHGN